MSSFVGNSIPRIVMPICDANLYTLKMSSYLFDRYWPSETRIDVVGYKNPDFEISPKMNFVSIDSSQKGGASSWSKYLLEYLNTIEDEYIIFTLEDFFPTASPNLDLLNKAQHMCVENPTIGRFDISIDTYTYPGYSIIQNWGPLKLLEKGPGVDYRISTQPAIWRKNFLAKILVHTTTPWDFEVNGSQISNKYGEKILAFGDPTYRNFPSYWIHKGAVSRYHKDKVNVLGLDPQTIKEMVNEGLLDEDKLQWGHGMARCPPFILLEVMISNYLGCRATKLL